MNRIYTSAFILISLLTNTGLSAQWSLDYLSQARFHHTAASAGNKIIFAGGSLNGLNPSNRVDFYDSESMTWSTDQLSVPRSFPVAVAAGSKIFIAGGMNVGNGQNYDRVEIYDVNTGEWNIESLSQSRAGLVAAHVGDNILFAGGGQFGSVFSSFTSTDVVDVYDLSTGSWLPVMHLSEPRIFPAVAVKITKYMSQEGY
ncbi:MAG: hypothetical protein IPM82_32310 [Saprospiraceae bacterium]|nr:hypothetical protein [Saprospiraceae bacterium]